MKNQYDYVVIGGGSGGIASARRAAMHGAKVLLIERGNLGGTCVNVGCVPKKMLWTTANIAETIHQSPHYGFSNAKAELSWEKAKTKRDEFIAHLRSIYAKNLDSTKVERVSGKAYFINANTVAIDGGRTVSAKHILVATGGAPRMPEIPGADLGMTSDGFFKLTSLPKSAAIVGGGYIAIEIAGILNAFGVKTTVFLRGKRILNDFDAEIALFLQEQMVAQGITFQFGTEFKEVKKNQTGLSLVDKKGKEFSSYESLLWAIGRTPSTQDLNLGAAGVKTDTKGFITVDSFQNTSKKGIYSVGDVTGKVALTPVAIAAGRALSERLFNKKAKAKIDYDRVPTVVFSHPPTGTIGLTEEEAIKKYGKGKTKVYRSKFSNLHYFPLPERPKTFMKLITTGKQEKIIGLHVVGLGADEMLQGFGVAVVMGATKKDFDRTIAIHPTAAEEFVTMR